MPFDSHLEPPITTSGPSDEHTSAEPVRKITAWSPCYICFDSYGVGSYSFLVIVRLLMHEIWVWENAMADEDQAKAEAREGFRSQPSQYNVPEKIPMESELLPCHYFDFFYGTAHGGLVATLLGRLRMRVDDAIDAFQNITRAMTSHKRLFTSDFPLGILDRPKIRSTDLMNAVHDTVMNHSTKTSKCGGTDELFRTHATILSPTSEEPRQAQTCIVAAVDIIYASHHRKKSLKMRSKKQLLRTFGFAAGHNRQTDILDPTFTDQLDLTICQVLWAAMATPGHLRPFKASIGTKTVEFTDQSPYESDPVKSAIQDYEFLYRSPNSSGQTPFLLPDSGSPIRVERSAKHVPAFFLSIGCSMVDSRPSRLRGLTDYGNLAHLKSLGREHMILRLSPDLRLNDGIKLESNRSASAFRATYDATKDAVNNDERLKHWLRRTADLLVHLRRDRQKMGGPRWEVFVSNTAKTNDWIGKERG